MNSQTQPSPTSPGYSQYANIPSQPDPAPPPPARNSSYETFNQHRASFRGGNNPDFPPPVNPNANSTSALPSALRNSNEPPPPAKKSVSFNTQMNTYKERTPNHSVSSYKSPTGSQSIEEMLPPPNFSPEADVFDSPNPPLFNKSNGSVPNTNRGTDVVYSTSNNTPNVIGAQEVYRDPRSRIEAKIASQSTGRTPSTDRMSFREKMKYFAAEAGEGTIKDKPKSSKTLRSIESQLNGQ